MLGIKFCKRFETTKQQLSDATVTSLDLSFIENELAVTLQQSEFNACIAHQVEKIMAKIAETVSAASVRPQDITAIFYTGGSSKVPVIRQTINAMFPHAEVVQGDAFGSVGMGLTIEAMRRS